MLAIVALLAGGLLGVSDPVGASVPGWNATEAPLPAGAGTGADEFVNLNSVSCSSASACVAVGTYGDAKKNLWGLIDTLSAGEWTTIPAPEPTDAGTDGSSDDQYAELFSVSCTADGGCTAVGQYEDDAGNIQALIDTLSGGTWTAVEAPLPTNAGVSVRQDNELDSVSCTAATACTAVGNYSESDGNIDALIDTLAGETWTATEAPLPPNAAAATRSDPYPELFSVSCTADGGCTAVGQYSDSSELSWAVIDTLSDGTWTATEAPEPANSGTDADGHQYAYLSSVSCISAALCTGVGTYDDTENFPYGLIESSAGGVWTATEAPQPSNAGTDGTTTQMTILNSVSCTTDGRCAGVGFYNQKNNLSYGLLETLSDGTWQDTQAPEPANAGTADGSAEYALLNSVVCLSAQNCTAVGSYATDDANQGLIETLSGGIWKTLEAPEPTDGATPLGNKTTLDALSCTPDGGCTAVGIASDEGGLIDTETPPPTLQITTTSPLPGGSVKTPYSTTLAAINGTPPYSWKLVAADGKLPPGLTLKAGTGVISGKPTASGTSTFTVEVLDQKTKTKPHTRDTASQAFSITIS